MRKRERPASDPDGVLPLTSPDMHVTYDAEADAAYFSVQSFKPRSVAQTVHLQDWLLADVDADGKLIGIEMLFVSTHLSPVRIDELSAAVSSPTIS